MLDTKKEHIAVTEANKLGIPVVAVVDTNVDPEVVQFPIPGNDDAIRANGLLARVIAEAVEEGRYIAAKRDPGNAPGRPRRAEEEAAFARRRPRPATPPPGPRPSARLGSPRPARPAPPRRPHRARRGDQPPADRAPSQLPSPAVPAESRAAEPPAEAAVEAGSRRRRAGGADVRPTSQPTPSDRRRAADAGRRHRPTETSRELIAMSFTAKDVKALRQATGAGMMDSKKALEATDGDIEAAKQCLREKGLAASAKRDDRENNQGVVALRVDGNVGAIVQLKCETDFVAGSEQFKAEAERWLDSRRHQGRRCGRPSAGPQLEELKILLKEKIELGEVVRFEAGPGSVLGNYEHVQGGRGVNGVLVELAGGNASWPTTSPSTSPSPGPSTSAARTCRPTWSRPSAQTLETITRNEGKPEQAVAEDRRGSPQRLLQGRLPARAALRQGRQAVDHAGPRRRPGSSASPRSKSADPSGSSPRWKRIVFKPSGEALAGPSGTGLDGDTLDNTADEIIDIRQNLDVDVAVVVGGGNFWRGRTGAMRAWTPPRPTTSACSAR